MVFQHVCFSPDPLLRPGHGPFDPGSLLLTSISDTDPPRAFSSDVFPKATRVNAKTAAISCVPPNPAMRRLCTFALPYRTFCTRSQRFFPQRNLTIIQALGLACRSHRIFMRLAADARDCSLACSFMADKLDLPINKTGESDEHRRSQTRTRRGVVQ
jgi:hypothetical protein